MLEIKLNHVNKRGLDIKFHGANMGPTWGRQVPGGSYVGPINLTIWDVAMNGGGGLNVIMMSIYISYKPSYIEIIRSEDYTTSVYLLDFCC